MRLGTFYRHVLLKNIGALECAKDKSVLDVGGFDGYMLSGLDSKEKTLIDPFAKETFNGIKYIKSDFLEYKFRDKKFDIIYSLDVIEHLPRQKEHAYLKKIYFLLKHGGTAIITTPSKSINIFPGFMTGFISRKWGHNKCRGYSRMELEKSLKASGIKKYKICSFHSRAYLGFYLTVRFLQILLPESAWNKIIAVIAKRDAKLEDNESLGYYLIRITK